MNKALFLSSAQLMGGVIGAGIFSLPFLLSTAGWLPFLIVVILFGVAATFLHLFFAEVVLRTEKVGTLSMYARKYLSKPVGKIISIITALGIGGALSVYVILSGVLLSIVFSSLEISPIYLSFFFVVVVSFIFLKKRQSFPSAEFFLTASLFLAMFLIAGAAIPFVDWQKIPSFDWRYVFMLPGVILFSLIGWDTLPSINRVLKKAGQQKKIGRIIICSIMIVVLSYLLFSLSFTGVGEDVYQWQVADISSFPLGGLFIILIAIVGFLISVVSFLGLANYLKISLINDFHLPASIAFSLIIFVPLLLLISGFDQFTILIGAVGTLMGAIEGIIIIILFCRAKKKGNRIPEYSLDVPRYFLYVLITILILGVGSQAIFYLL